MSETLDWAAALVALDRAACSTPDVIDETLGVLLKHQEDIQAVSGERLQMLLGRALTRTPAAAPDLS